MGYADALRQLLRSLCHNTQWKYAVYWKLDDRNHMELSWEDAYFDNTKSSFTFHNGLFSGKSGIISFGTEVDAKNINSPECPIELTVANMSSRTYFLGEGIVGSVASSKKHQWIFSSEYNSNLLPECQKDCQLQFAAGIKTILLVPVTPLGVVQFGSLHTVMEDPTMAAHVTDLFSILQHIAGTHVSPTSRLDNLDLDTHTTMPPVEDLSATSALSKFLVPINSLPTSANNDLADLEFCQLPNNELSTISYQLQAEDVLDQVFGMDVFIDDSSQKVMHRELVAHTAKKLSILNHSIYPGPDHIIDGGMSQIPKFSDELNAFTAMNNAFTPTDSFVPNYYMYGEEHINERCFDLPFHSELHKVLGLGSLEEYDEHIWNTIISKNDELSNSICHREVPEIYEPLVGKTSELFIDKSETEQLLDAIIANLHHASDNDVSDISRCIRSGSNSSGSFPDSCLTHFKTDDDIVGFEDSAPCKHKTHVSFPKKEGLISSPAGSLPKTTVSLLTNEEHHIDDMTSEHDKGGVKSLQRSKKRGRSSDFRGLRPRDRQLIQDRLKELRELIPNGSKCSIDVLLDHTVKHMLFLQSIPRRAEKLRQSTYPKIQVDGQKASGSEVYQNGTSWACEMGGQPQECPLIVENLDQPGHMLVEMLCKEYGLFLEIVQVIKSLKLTILKGVLESRSDKLWAHFIIEASRGFYRMDILLPLMQLLQRN